MFGGYSTWNYVFRDRIDKINRGINSANIRINGTAPYRSGGNTIFQFDDAKSGVLSFSNVIGSVPMRVLAVAGGGGGGGGNINGNTSGGGGGGGGVFYNETNVGEAITMQFAVGEGGIAGVFGNIDGNTSGYNGGNTIIYFTSQSQTFGNITTFGGGGGGNTTAQANTGGSAGGAGYSITISTAGNTSESNYASSGGKYVSGTGSAGGGGAGSPGIDASSGIPANGGNGYVSSITGTTLYWGGGGGGGMSSLGTTESGNAGNGGLGGGGGGGAQLVAYGAGGGNALVSGSSGGNATINPNFRGGSGGAGTGGGGGGGSNDYRISNYLEKATLTYGSWSYSYDYPPLTSIPPSFQQTSISYAATTDVGNIYLGTASTYAFSQGTYEIWFRRRRDFTQARTPPIAFLIGKQNVFSIRLNTDLSYIPTDYVVATHYPGGVATNVISADISRNLGWVHAALTFNSGSTARLYVNGQLRGSATMTAFNQTTAPVTVGSFDTTDRSYRIHLTNARVWNVERSQADISNNRFKILQAGDAIGLVGSFPLNNKDDLKNYAVFSGGHGGSGTSIISVPSTNIKEYEYYCSEFSGSPGNIFIQHNFNEINISAVFTMEACVKINGNISGNNAIFGLYPLLSGPGYGFSVNNNILFFYYAGTIRALDGVNISDNQWHHLVFGHNGKNTFAYVDGDLKGNSIRETNDTPSIVNTGVTVGMVQVVSAGPLRNYFTGRLYNFRVWNYERITFEDAFVPITKPTPGLILSFPLAIFPGTQTIYNYSVSPPVTDASYVAPNWVLDAPSPQKLFFESIESITSSSFRISYNPLLAVSQYEVLVKNAKTNEIANETIFTGSNGIINTGINTETTLYNIYVCGISPSGKTAQSKISTLAPIKNLTVTGTTNTSISFQFTTDQNAILYQTYTVPTTTTLTINPANPVITGLNPNTSYQIYLLASYTIEGSTANATISPIIGINANSFNGIYDLSASSSGRGSNLVYYAFDGNDATTWITDFTGNNGYTQNPYDNSGNYVGGGTGKVFSTITQNAGTISGEYLQIKTSFKHSLEKYTIKTKIPYDWPQKYTIAGSTDGTNWTSLFQETTTQPTDLSLNSSSFGTNTSILTPGLTGLRLAVSADNSRMFLSRNEGQTYYSTFNKLTGSWSDISVNTGSTTGNWRGVTMTYDGNRAIAVTNAGTLYSYTWNGTYYANETLSNIPNTAFERYSGVACNEDGSRIGIAGYNINDNFVYIYFSTWVQSNSRYEGKTLVDKGLNYTSFSSIGMSRDGNAIVYGTNSRTRYAVWNGSNYTIMSTIITTLTYSPSHSIFPDNKRILIGNNYTTVSGNTLSSTLTPISQINITSEALTVLSRDGGSIYNHIFNVALTTVIYRSNITYFNAPISNTLSSIPQYDYYRFIINNTSSFRGNPEITGIEMSSQVSYQGITRLSPPAQIPDLRFNNPIHYYKLNTGDYSADQGFLNYATNDSGAYDASAISLVNGSLVSNKTNLLTTSTFAVGNASVSLSPTIKSHIQLNSFSTTANTTGLSVTFWVKCGVDASNTTLFDFATSSAAANRIACILVNGKPSFYVGNVSGTLSQSIVTDSNKWNHMMWLIDTTGKWIVYQNGLRIDSVISGVSLPTNVTRTLNYIGRNTTDTTANITANAYIDDFRLWNSNISSPDFIYYSSTSNSVYDPSNLVVTSTGETNANIAFIRNQNTAYYYVRTYPETTTWTIVDGNSLLVPGLVENIYNIYITGYNNIGKRSNTLSVSLLPRLTSLQITSTSDLSAIIQYASPAGANKCFLYTYPTTSTTETTDLSQTTLVFDTPLLYTVYMYAANTTAGTLSLVSSIQFLPPPTSIYATSITETSIKIEYSSVAGANSYTIYTSPASSVITTSSLSYLVTGLTANTEYTFYVSAANTVTGQRSFPNKYIISTFGSTVYYYKMDTVDVSGELFANYKNTSGVGMDASGVGGDGTVFDASSLVFVRNTLTTPSVGITSGSFVYSLGTGSEKYRNGTYDVSASSYNNIDVSSYLWGAVDNTFSTFWKSATAYNGTGDYIGTVSTVVYDDIGSQTIAGEWLQLKMPYRGKMVSYTISAELVSSSMMPKKMYVAGSNDGTTWTSVDYIDIPTGSISEINQTPTSTKYYRYFRIITNKTFGGDFVSFGKWDIYVDAWITPIDTSTFVYGNASLGLLNGVINGVRNGNSRVQLPPFTISSGTGMAISYWMKTDISSGTLFDIADATAGNTMSMRLTGNGIPTFYMYQGAQTYSKTLISPVANSSWNHFIWNVGTDGKWTSYVNGLYYDPSFNLYPTATTRGNVFLGYDISSGLSTNMYVDEFRLWNKPLDDKQATMLYYWKTWIPGLDVSAVSISGVTDSSAIVQYSLNGNASLYEIRTYPHLGNVTTSGNSYVLEGFAGGTSYNIYVTGLNSSGGRSETKYETLYGAPAMLSVIDVSGPSANITYSPVSGVSGYTIEYTNNSATLSTVTTTDTSYSVNNFGSMPNTVRVYSKQPNGLIKTTLVNVFAPTTLSVTSVGDTYADISFDFVTGVSYYEVETVPTSTKQLAYSSPFRIVNLSDIYNQIQIRGVQNTNYSIRRTFNVTIEPTIYYRVSTNIHFAGSVRICVDGYTGPVVRVRHSNDNVEQDFYTDRTQSYLTTGAGNTGTSYATWITGATGYITIWYNQKSGSTNHATNTDNNTTQPTLVLRNSKYIVQWTNANANYLKLQTHIVPNTIFSQFWNNVDFGTIACQANSSGAPVDRVGMRFYQLNVNGSSNYGDWYYSSSGTKISYVNGVSSTTLTDLSKWKTFSCSVTTSALGTDIPTSGFLFIGRDGYSTGRSINGYMTEFIFHNKVMSSNMMVDFYNNRLVTDVS